ncbi:piRNA biogenesis protein EXD1 isoform X1 [Hydra vulgaris]|uniref:piRNA biogenesis protein EXD1 isoform X1 n=1 Tax=Hydra vulgaris TaxID=6087 RepID=UPI001F5E657D|nr:piRNA biogenesis protein EXD1 [Hydra vulgaris]
MDMHIGALIQITTINDEVYEGVVQTISIDEKKIIIKKAKNCNTGEVYEREVHLFGDQITDLKIIQNPAEKEKKAEGKKQPSKLSNLSNEFNNIKVEQTLSSINQTDISQKKDVLLDTSDNGSSLTQINHINPSAYLSGFEKVQKAKLTEPPLAVLLNSLNNEFNAVMTKLNNQKVLSIIAEGQAVNRFGHISLLTVASREMVYIIDLEAFDGFPNSLKDLIENANVLKVVHDVRMTSDCLYHIYGICPKNIFDTQVADAFIKRQMFGEFPDEVTSLAKCVETYLGICPCTFETDKSSIIQKTRNIWEKRPLHKDFLSVCAEACMYLRELRPIMMEKLLIEFLYGVDIYLDVARNMSDNQIKLVNSKKLPREFSHISYLKQNRSKRFVKHSKQHYKDKTSDTPAENVRSGWDDGVNFHDKYQEKHGSIVECLDNTSSPLIDPTKPVLKRKDEENSPKETARILDATRNFYDKDENERFNIGVNSSVHQTFSNGNFEDLSVFQFSKYNQVNLNALDDNTMSSTSDSNDDFFSSKVGKPLSKRHTHTLTNSGKTMLRNLLRPVKNENSNPKEFQQHATNSNKNGSFKNHTEKTMSSSKNISSTYNNTASFKNEEIKTPIVKKSFGRGQYLALMSELFEKNPSRNEPKTFGEMGVFEFPSDDELLDTPHVAPMVASLPALSKSVSVLKK